MTVAFENAGNPRVPRRELSKRPVSITVIALVPLLVITSCLGSSAPSTAYPPLTRALLSAVNEEYVGVYSFTLLRASVPTSEVATAHSAAGTVIRTCNEGRGTTVVAVGLVKGSISKHPLFAVFVNPPGSHEPASGQGSISTQSGGGIVNPPPQSVAPNNWYAGFVTAGGEPFCTFGHSELLPVLPTH